MKINQTNILHKFNNIILLTSMIAFACILIFNVVSWDIKIWISTCYTLLRILIIIAITYLIDIGFNRQNGKEAIKKSDII